MPRLTISLTRTAAVWAHRVTLGAERLVYVITADRLITYPNDKSRIAYIGTTKNGSARIAESVAHRASTILRMRGVSELYVRIVTCSPRQHVKTWHKLERALLLQFKEEYGKVPVCNSHGKNYVWTDVTVRAWT